MKLIICLTFNLLIFAGRSSAQKNTPAASPRLVINLGESPWKFKKLVVQSGEAVIALNKTTGNGLTLPQVKIAELKATEKITLVKNYFTDTSLHTAFYKLEGSANGSDWVMLTDKTSAGAAVSYQSAGDVKSTGNTVGYVEKRKSAYFNIPVSGQYRFIKLTITKLSKSNGAAVSTSQGELQVYGPGGVAAAGEYQSTSFNDGDWETVGIPHCFNDLDTYPNTNSPQMWHGAVWYRKQIRYAPQFSGKKIFLEFDGVNTGAAVYVNGKFQPGNTEVKQPGEVTHVGGFLPFALDITKDMLAGADNVIAVKVSNAPNDFFTWPGFGVYENFGMGWGGIVCPVKLYSLNKVHMPLNASLQPGSWGTYNAVVAADSSRAAVRLQTNIKNEDAVAHTISLQSILTDKSGKTVASISLHKMVAAGAIGFFDTVLNVNGPHLWYPNNSPYGKPYLYKVVRIVKADGLTADRQSENLGIRTITWDNNYCYINHKKHLLNGFGNRNIYPGLGSAVPAEIQWQDVKLIADAGGNALRVGHVPATRVTLEACDAYGVLVMDDSGDNEWALKNEPANTYKQEYDRDMMVNFRNYACVAVWESNNGLAKDGIKYLPSKTLEIADRWDPLQHRLIASRDGYPAGWDGGRPIMVGYSNGFKKVASSPSINTEVYGAFWDGRRCFNIARADYTDEKVFSEWYVDNWLHDIDNGACGWIDWMLAETQGEGYTIYLNGMSKQRSLGSCAMDGNRFPKLKYNIFKNALWYSFKAKPGATLQSSWNLAGPQSVDAWSNCPEAELYLNGKSLGKHTPDAKTKRCTWPKIEFKPGKLKLVGLDAKGRVVCADSVVTAGKPDHILLTAEKNLTAPDGSAFLIKANGSDAALVKATIVDKDGNWCPDAENTLRFNVTGDADYKGSYNFYVVPGQPASYHSPGDHELSAEGGLMKIAIRARFKPGRVQVQATSPGLKSGATSFLIHGV